MRLMAVDWSGSQDVGGQRKHIWVAEGADPAAVTLTNERTREETIAHVVAAAASDPELVAGFDFAFSFPAWFTRSLGVAEAPALWRCAANEGERWLTGCEPPFWGRPGRSCPEGHRAVPGLNGSGWLGYRVTDRDAAKRVGRLPSSPFQVGGAGAVGTGSVRGMPWLLALRRAGFAIWPFDEPPDEPRCPIALEIYPRLFTGRTKVSQAAARARWLDQPSCSEVPEQALADARRSPDAFDALAALLGMMQHRDELAHLPACSNADRRLEGAIWMPRDDASPAGAQL